MRRESANDVFQRSRTRQSMSVGLSRFYTDGYARGTALRLPFKDLIVLKLVLL